MAVVLLDVSLDVYNIPYKQHHDADDVIQPALDFYDKDIVAKSLNQNYLGLHILIEVKSI